MRRNSSTGHLQRSQSGSLRVIFEEKPGFEEPEMEEARILRAYPGSPGSQRAATVRQNGIETPCCPAGAHPIASVACGSHECRRGSDQPGFPATAERKQHGSSRALALLRSASCDLGAGMLFRGRPSNEDEDMGRSEPPPLLRRADSAGELFDYDSAQSDRGFYASERVVRGSSCALDALSSCSDIAELVYSDGDSVASMSATPTSPSLGSYFQRVCAPGAFTLADISTQAVRNPLSFAS